MIKYILYHKILIAIEKSEGLLFPVNLTSTKYFHSKQLETQKYNCLPYTNIFKSMV